LALLAKLADLFFMNEHQAKERKQTDALRAEALRLAFKYPELKVGGGSTMTPLAVSQPRCWNYRH